MAGHQILILSMLVRIQQGQLYAQVAEARLMH